MKSLSVFKGHAENGFGLVPSVDAEPSLKPEWLKQPSSGQRGLPDKFRSADIRGRGGRLVDGGRFYQRKSVEQLKSLPPPHGALSPPPFMRSQSAGSLLTATQIKQTSITVALIEGDKSEATQPFHLSKTDFPSLSSALQTQQQQQQPKAPKFFKSKSTASLPTSVPPIAPVLPDAVSQQNLSPRNSNSAALINQASTLLAAASSSSSSSNPTTSIPPAATTAPAVEEQPTPPPTNPNVEGSIPDAVVPSSCPTCPTCPTETPVQPEPKVEPQPPTTLQRKPSFSEKAAAVPPPAPRKLTPKEKFEQTLAQRQELQKFRSLIPSKPQHPVLTKGRGDKLRLPPLPQRTKVVLSAAAAKPNSPLMRKATSAPVLPVHLLRSSNSIASALIEENYPSDAQPTAQPTNASNSPPTKHASPQANGPNQSPVGSPPGSPPLLTAQPTSTQFSAAILNAASGANEVSGAAASLHEQKALQQQRIDYLDTLRKRTDQNKSSAEENDSSEGEELDWEQIDDIENGMDVKDVKKKQQQQQQQQVESSTKSSSPSSNEQDWPEDRMLALMKKFGADPDSCLSEGGEEEGGGLTEEEIRTVQEKVNSVDVKKERERLKTGLNEALQRWSSKLNHSQNGVGGGGSPTSGSPPLSPPLDPASGSPCSVDSLDSANSIDLANDLSDSEDDDDDDDDGTADSEVMIVGIALA